ncbi:MAG: hypothetical protein MUC36_21400 [Planctomycetes bacterium]|jgi:hypothetical protein|nr:hypothetical protein [Planctomycetota bacterium]
MTWGTWQPTRLRHTARVIGSSMDTVEIQTDLGPGFLKALGNRQGEHALACELIGSSLAEWIGLPTLDFTLFQVGADQVLLLDADEKVPITQRRRAKPGPAFLSRGIHAATWDSLPPDLEKLDNPHAIAGLVLLDTWIGNPDRHPRRPADASFSTWQGQNPDNVLLEILPKNRRRLVAMDFTVCLHCRGGGLRSSYEDRLVRDDGVYGLFPAFEPYIREPSIQPFVERLRAPSLPQDLVALLGRIPSEWQVDARTRSAVATFLSARAAYLVDNFVGNLQRVAPSTGQ